MRATIPTYQFPGLDWYFPQSAAARARARARARFAHPRPSMGATVTTLKRNCSLAWPRASWGMPPSGRGRPAWLDSRLPLSTPRTETLMAAGAGGLPTASGSSLTPTPPHPSPSLCVPPHPHSKSRAATRAGCTRGQGKTLHFSVLSQPVIYSRLPSLHTPQSSHSQSVLYSRLPSLHLKPRNGSSPYCHPLPPTAAQAHLGGSNCPFHITPWGSCQVAAGRATPRAPAAY